MEIRPLHLPGDVDVLADLDVGSTSNTVFEVVSSAGGFALTEVPVSTPVTKTHEFLADLTDSR